MKLTKMFVSAVGIALLAGGALIATGHAPAGLTDALQGLVKKGEASASAPAAAPPAAHAGPAPLAVSAVRVAPAEFVATVLVTGSLVPREEILVGPEIEGLRVVEVLADEGDRVKKGQVLARLVTETLDAQIAQNEANLARSNASIAQAQSTIVSAEARLVEARNAYNRGVPLKQSGYLSESLMDQRESAARTAEAALATARDGLKLAQAELAQIQAQRRELDWRRSKTAISAPADGIVSRRVARIGGYATGAADSMFRIIAKGEIELDAEVVEAGLPLIREGQPVRIETAGAKSVTGSVRLVSPEVDKATRLGRVRVFIGDTPDLRVGAFARGLIETGRSRGLSVPLAAVLYTAEGASVQVIRDGRVATRRVTLGLQQGANVEVASGVVEGDLVVAKSGTFLRDGDAVAPVPPATASPLASN